MAAPSHNRDTAEKGTITGMEGRFSDTSRAAALSREFGGQATLVQLPLDAVAVGQRRRESINAHWATFCRRVDVQLMITCIGSASGLAMGVTSRNREPSGVTSYPAVR